LISLNSDLIFSILWSISAIVVLVRFRGMRPTVRRIMRQPGAVACWTSSTIGIIAFTPLIIHAVLDLFGLAPLRSLYVHPFKMKFWLDYSLGYAVAVSWILLALSGRWRPESGWIDRIGVVVGTSLIVCCLGVNLRMYLSWR